MDRTTSYPEPWFGVALFSPLLFDGARLRRFSRLRSRRLLVANFAYGLRFLLFGVWFEVNHGSMP